jgi:hypothetical protein
MRRNRATDVMLVKHHLDALRLPTIKEGSHWDERVRAGGAGMRPGQR